MLFVSRNKRTCSSSVFLQVEKVLYLKKRKKSHHTHTSKHTHTHNTHTERDTQKYTHRHTDTPHSTRKQNPTTISSHLHLTQSCAPSSRCWCWCWCYRLLASLTWWDPCSAVYFSPPFSDHLKVSQFIQQNISACQLRRADVCRRYIFPLQVALAANFSLAWALVREQPSVVWTPVTLELISLPISCSIWVMANLLCVSGERCLLCYFLALWLANYFLLKLGQPIPFVLFFFLPQQFICPYHFLDVDINVTLLQMVCPMSPWSPCYLSFLWLSAVHCAEWLPASPAVCPHQASNPAQLKAFLAGLQGAGRTVSSGVAQALWKAHRLLLVI